MAFEALCCRNGAINTSET